MHSRVSPSELPLRYKDRCGGWFLWAKKSEDLHPRGRGPAEYDLQPGCVALENARLFEENLVRADGGGAEDRRDIQVSMLPIRRRNRRVHDRGTSVPAGRWGRLLRFIPSTWRGRGNVWLSWWAMSRGRPFPVRWSWRPPECIPGPDGELCDGRGGDERANLRLKQD